VGRVTTPWYTLPGGTGPAGTVTVLVAGSLVEGNSLNVEYGRRAGDDVIPSGAEELSDPARDTSWRTLTVTPPAGMDVLRLDGVDASGGLGGWLAFSAPVAARPVPLSTFLPRAAPVALAWPIAFNWPCQRQPGIVNGITEPAAFAVLWGDKGNLSGLSDGAWVPSRGGAFAQVPRSQSVLQLATVPPVDPDVQVYVFASDLGRDRYTLIERRRTVGGASTAVGRDTGG
jgi:arabinosyltransferase C